MNEYAADFLKTNENMFSKDQRDLLESAFEMIYLRGEINGMTTHTPQLFVPPNPYVGN